MVVPVKLDFECWQLTTGERILCTSRYCSMPFLWKGRKCVMTSNSSLRLVVYDYLNQQVIGTFQKSCLPSYHSINYIANLGENNFLICVDYNFVFVLSLESSSEFFAFSFINDCSYPRFCTLFPDNLYVACSYGSPILRIMKVDNGKTLQTVAPKQKMIACWWSKLYLWVVCEGPVVTKYPYTPTHRYIVGNYAEECSIDCDGDVLKFEAGVLVCKQKDRKIFILKICHGNFSSQQILDSKFKGSCNVTISSDACALLLYHIGEKCYELWEMGSENKWELHSTEKLYPSTVCGCLTGKQNSRCLLWLVNSVDDLRGSSDLSPHELPGAMPLMELFIRFQ